MTSETMNRAPGPPGSTLDTATPQPAKRAGAAPSRQSKRAELTRAARRRAMALWRGVVGSVGVAAIYQVIASLGLVDKSLLPPVWNIMRDTIDLAVDPVFVSAVGNTLAAVAVGITISFVVGSLAGLAFGVSTLAYRVIRGPIDMMRSIPSVAMIPLLVLTLGQGSQMKMFVAAYVSLWPILFNTTYGVRSVDPLAKDAARSFGLSEPRVWLRVVIPSTAPAIVTGLRVALPLALTVAISAEIAVGSPDGIGGFILQTSYNDFNASRVFAAVVLAGVVGWALNGVAAGVGDRLMRWDTRR